MQYLNFLCPIKFLSINQREILTNECKILTLKIGKLYIKMNKLKFPPSKIKFRNQAKSDIFN